MHEGHTPGDHWVRELAPTMREVDPTVVSAEALFAEVIRQPVEQRIRVICLDARKHGIDKLFAWLAALDAAEVAHDDPIDGCPIVHHRILIGRDEQFTDIPLGVQRRSRAGQNAFIEREGEGDALSQYQDWLREGYNDKQHL